MDGKEEYGQYSVRTDLALEANEMLLEERSVSTGKDISHIEGVIIKEKKENDMTVSLIEVTEEGAKHIGKKVGS